MRSSALPAAACSLLLAACSLLTAASAQAPARVDFARDVQPILRQNCTSCHGADDQEAGLRLDRRSSAVKAITRRIVPGNSANSLLYHRVLADNQFGPPMPPGKQLNAAQVATIREWIDQGADWPAALANELDLPPIDPAAVAAVDLLRTGALPRFVAAVTARPALLNARGPEGSTPFMYAVLYADAPTLTRLLRLGADVNAHNDAGATALLWGVHDPARAAVLIAAGADVNAKSADFRTPLMVAARQPGNVAVVRLLLDHGANPNPNEIAAAQSSPLLEAATAGDAASFALLNARGAHMTSEAEAVLTIATVTGCVRCVALAVPQVTAAPVYTSALEDTAFLADPASIRMMLAHGADAKAFDSYGHTALMSVATSDVLSVESVRLLLEHGADPNARSRHAHSGDSGQSVLDMALRHGRTPVSDYLIAAGAQPSQQPSQQPGQQPASVLDPRFLGGFATNPAGLNKQLRDAIAASLPLLQHADVKFARNSGCVSCHDNSLTQMTVAGARRQGLPVDEGIAAAQLHVTADLLTRSRDFIHQGFLLPVEDNFADNVYAYILVGMHAENWKPDLDTDAAAMLILWRQKANGQWPEPHADTRQPLGLNFIGETAMNLRALELYAPAGADHALYTRAIRLAAAWLASARSRNNEDRSWRTIGLAWAGTNRPALAAAVAELKAAQKPDGGWSDLPTMASSAYATGKSLVALHTAGMAASDPVYRRGVHWLLAQQQADGTWYVPTRALAFQPWSDAEFPHGPSQFISAAGTNWAAMALTFTLPQQPQTLPRQKPAPPQAGTKLAALR